jgi:hypothetical protein
MSEAGIPLISPAVKAIGGFVSPNAPTPEAPPIPSSQTKNGDQMQSEEEAQRGKKMGMAANMLSGGALGNYSKPLTSRTVLLGG